LWRSWRAPDRKWLPVGNSARGGRHRSAVGSPYHRPPQPIRSRGDDCTLAAVTTSDTGYRGTAGRRERAGSGDSRWIRSIHGRDDHVLARTCRSNRPSVKNCPCLTGFRAHPGAIFRRWLHLVYVMLVATAGCTNAVCGGSEPIYRYINLTDGTRILLGEPFRRQDIAQRLDDSTFALRRESFDGGGTTEIRLGVDSSGVLRIMTFVYDGSESLQAKIGTYTGSLGAPVEKQMFEQGASSHVWRDADTRFELWWTPHRQPRFWSRLVDLRRTSH
jgi:hypothetical protein